MIEVYENIEKDLINSTEEKKDQDQPNSYLSIFSHSVEAAYRI